MTGDSCTRGFACFFSCLLHLLKTNIDGDGGKSQIKCDRNGGESRCAKPVRPFCVQYIEWPIKRHCNNPSGPNHLTFSRGRSTLRGVKHETIIKENLRHIFYTQAYDIILNKNLEIFHTNMFLSIFKSHKIVLLEAPHLIWCNPK